MFHRNTKLKKMKLLKDIEINSFTAINFVSQKAREIWEPIINDCNELVQELELLSVAEDQRRCAWRTVKTSETFILTRKCLDLGLSVYPIENIGSWGNGFTHKTKPAIEGKPMSTYCVITKDIKHAQEYRDAFSKGDHRKQGELLGFPKCCTEFFMNNWPEYFDPMWQCCWNSIMSQDYNDETAAWVANVKKDYCSPLSNPLLRYIGLRIGFHIPCSLDCQETNRIAAERINICKSDQKNTMKLLIGLLSMPIEWSLLHGIALIKTPIFQFRANSMPSEEKYIVRLHGDFIPREAPSGTEFPYTNNS